MAIIIAGKTVCILCGKRIERGDDITSFPAFLPNTHELGRFSDAAFHRSCFEKSPERDAVMDLYERYRAIWDSRPRDLKTVEEMEAWGKEAFKGFP